MDSRTPTPSSVLPLGLGVLLVGAAGLLINPRTSSAADLEVNRYQIRIVNQAAGASAVVLVDSVTGETWAQRIGAGITDPTWSSLGKPR